MVIEFSIFSCESDCRKGSIFTAKLTMSLSAGSLTSSYSQLIYDFDNLVQGPDPVTSFRRGSRRLPAGQLSRGLYAPRHTPSMRTSNTVFEIFGLHGEQRLRDGNGTSRKFHGSSKDHHVPLYSRRQDVVRNSAEPSTAALIDITLEGGTTKPDKTFRPSLGDHAEPDPFTRVLKEIVTLEGTGNVVAITSGQNHGEVVDGYTLPPHQHIFNRHVAHYPQHTTATSPSFTAFRGVVRASDVRPTSAEVGRRGRLHTYADLGRPVQIVLSLFEFQREGSGSVQ
ncbi:hypothetical protein K438DRAFT_1772388 [Mycena galopus ATCC 62051]|nr:hypothetical protein K438DRAFT_1772388 [Mycena galopus ATCC 62051]